MKNITQNEFRERIQDILNGFKEMDFFQQCEKLQFISELRESISDTEVRKLFWQIESLFYEESQNCLGYGINKDKRPALMQVF